MESFSFEVLETLPKVEFIDLAEQHCYDEDFTCHFRLNDYKIKEGDRIAILKLGWKYLKDYVVFEWVGKECNCAVTFKEENLPKDMNEIYQLCYITGENKVVGASSPIQFFKKTQNMLQSQSALTDSGICNTDIKQMNDKVIKLREENEMLKDILKTLVSSNKLEKFEKTMDELRVMVKCLQDKVSSQQNEIEALKKELKEHCCCQNRQTKSNLYSSELQRHTFVNKKFEFTELPSIPPLNLPK